ncbi:MAG: alpha/beta hydrolase fold domain-containing protein [Atopobiaceae bacterium]|jgi:acetyl esterase
MSDATQLSCPIHVSTTRGGAPQQDVQCGISVWAPFPEQDKHTAIFYLHGGGLLFGGREDLPQEYRDLVCSRGYTLVAADYPLAPEVFVTEINRVVFDIWTWCEENVFAPRSITRAFLFGRSAGAYLALMLAHNIQKATSSLAAASQTPELLGVIDFYGYYTLSGLMDAALKQPGPYFRRVAPRIAPTMARKLVGTTVLTSASLEKRLALYIYARQSGCWGELIGSDEGKAHGQELGTDDILALPPLYIAASTQDMDVPYACSLELSHTAPDATLFTVSDLDHDFDRDPTVAQAQQAWEGWLAWADERVAAARA